MSETPHLEQALVVMLQMQKEIATAPNAPDQILPYMMSALLFAAASMQAAPEWIMAVRQEAETSLPKVDLRGAARWDPEERVLARIREAAAALDALELVAERDQAMGMPQGREVR